jgi:hypothetical protein
MKRIIVLAIACALAPLASAQLYKYVDKNGKTVYTDQPPPDAEAKPMANVPPPAAPSKSYVERDKELQKGRDKVKDDAKKADEKSKYEAAKAERCRQATEAARIYEQGGRLQKRNAAGESEFMSDEEIEAARQKSRREVEEACKT